MFLPLIRIHWSSGVECYAFEGVRTPSEFYLDLLVAVEPIVREVPATPNSYRVSSSAVVLSNVSGHFSELRDAVHFQNVRVDLLFGDSDSGLASFTTLFSARITKDYEITPLTCRLPIKDYSFERFDSKLGGYLNHIDFPFLPGSSELYLKPIIFGNVSSALSGSNTGGVPCYLVDPAVGGSTYKYLVARHRCASVDNAYQYETLIGPSHALTGYTVTEEVIGGETHTFLNFATDPRDTSRPDEFEIRADVQGLMGGSPEALITNPMEQFRAYLETFAGVDPTEIDDTLWNAAEAAADLNGYVGAGAILKKDTTHLDVIDRFVESFGSPFFSSREGKFGVFIFSLDQLAALDLAGLEILSDELDILRDSFSFRGPEQPATRLQYNYAYNWVRDYFERQPDHINSTEETALGHSVRSNANLWYVRDESAAETLAIERNYLEREKQQFPSFALPISKYTLDLNDYIKLTHFRGAGEDGYVETICRLISLRIDVQPLSMRVTAQAVRVTEVNDFWGRYFLLGDETEIATTWGAATDADKQYGYLSDEDDVTGSPEGTLGLSDPGKLLF